MPKLKVLNDNQEYDIPAGTPLVEYCNDNQTSIPFGCQAGACGTCRIRVMEKPEGFEPIKDDEQSFLRDFVPGSHQDDRLACQCVVVGDVTVQVVDSGQHNEVANQLKD